MACASLAIENLPVFRLFEHDLLDGLFPEPVVELAPDLLPMEQQGVSPRGRLDPDVQAPAGHPVWSGSLRDLRPHDLIPQQYRPLLQKAMPDPHVRDQTTKALADGDRPPRRAPAAFYRNHDG